jgi:hypothetical protein
MRTRSGDQRLLPCYGSSQRLGRSGEGCLEGVAHGLEDDPAVGFDRLAQGVVLDLQGGSHLLRGALPHRCGTLDIGK